MSSSFGLTTTKMKQLLSKLKKKFVVVPRVKSYKLVEKGEQASIKEDKVKRAVKSTERRTIIKDEDFTTPL